MKKYIIFLDILGFKDLPKEIANEIKRPNESNFIRQTISDHLKKNIKNIKKEKGVKVVKKGSDDYLLMVDCHQTDGIQTVFKIIEKITKIDIPFTNQCIPFEMAVGTEKICEDMYIENINRDEIIDFLKNDIVNPYCNYYKNKYIESIKETFVLFTQEFFEELDPLDKKYCKKILSHNKTFFVIDLEKIWQRCKGFEFLEKIGFNESKWYDRIDSLYVPPLECNEIKNALKKDRIVFITGSPEYGKTYTSARLMWEYYYNNNYEP